MRSFAVCILFMATTVVAGETFLLQDGQRVVFLGDSNTYAGKYIAYLDAYLCTRFPDQRLNSSMLAPAKPSAAFRNPIIPIHPNANGHLVFALEILKEWKAPTAVKENAIDVGKELLRGAADPPTQPGVTITLVQRNSVVAAGSAFEKEARWAVDDPATVSFVFGI